VQATADSEKSEPGVKESEAESLITQCVPRITILEESLNQFKSRVEDLEVSLSTYLNDADSLNKAQSFESTLQKAISTGLFGSDRPCATGEVNQEAITHISVQSASTLPEEDREPMPAGSFVLDGRIVAPPAIHEEATDLDSCLTEANEEGHYCPGACDGSGSALEASLPSCTTELPDVGNSLPSTPSATAHPMMPSNGQGTSASVSLSPSGSQSVLLDPDTTLLTATRQSRAGTAVLANSHVVGQSSVLGMHYQFQPQTQQRQKQQKQHGSQAKSRQASQPRWTAPTQPPPSVGVPPPPDAWSPQEPQSATNAERHQGSGNNITGSVCIITSTRKQSPGGSGSVRIFFPTEAARLRRNPFRKCLHNQPTNAARLSANHDGRQFTETTWKQRSDLIFPVDTLAG